MPKEYEYQFFDYNKSEIIKKIKHKDRNSYKGLYLFKVQEFIHPAYGEKTHFRIRDEEYRITMAVKTKTEDFDDEEEIIIDNFDEGIALLLHIGCKKTIYYEKLREIWDISKYNTEIVFDTYLDSRGNPIMQEIMEIESKTFKQLQKMIKYFKLDIFKLDIFKLDIFIFEYYTMPFTTIL